MNDTFHHDATTNTNNGKRLQIKKIYLCIKQHFNKKENNWPIAKHTIERKSKKFKDMLIVQL